MYIIFFVVVHELDEPARAHKQTKSSLSKRKKCMGGTQTQDPPLQTSSTYHQNHNCLCLQMNDNL